VRSVAACGGKIGDSTTAIEQAATASDAGTITISGSAVDSVFPQATFQSCLAVTPDVVNLNNLTASTTVNFVGTGTDAITNCAPAAMAPPPARS
jgi:hypothetical protein